MMTIWKCFAWRERDEIIKGRRTSSYYAEAARNATPEVAKNLRGTTSVLISGSGRKTEKGD